MSSAYNADQRDLAGIDPLQPFAVPDRDKPVPGAMNDVGMTVYMADPFVGAQVITQYIPHRQDGQKAFYHDAKIIIRRIEDEIAWFVFRCNVRCKAAADAASIYDDVVFGVFSDQNIINELHVVQHVFFAAFAGTFAKAPVIYQHYIVTIAVKITRILSPAFYAAGVAMKIKDQSFGIGAVKVESVNAHARRNIKE